MRRIGLLGGVLAGWVLACGVWGCGAREVRVMPAPASPVAEVALAPYPGAPAGPPGMMGGMGGGGQAGFGAAFTAGRAAGEVAPAGAAPDAETQANAAPGAGAPGAPTESLDAMDATARDRYLIRNAIVAVEVADARAALQQVTEAVQAVNGYVSNLTERVDPLGVRSVSVQVRVPADSFDATMGSLDALGKVSHRNVTTQDVTEEYVDTEARLRNLKATEGRLLDHLARTGMMEDILAIERELDRVRSEIERLEGRMRFLSHRVAFSTIDLTLTEAPKAAPVVPPETFSTARTVTDATRTLVAFARGIWVRVLYLLVWTPVWGGVLLVLWALGRLLRRATRRRARPAAATPASSRPPSD